MLEISKIYSGFRLHAITEIKEIDSIGYEFEHEKSGARLFFLENKDDNKVFSISFRTPPEDSTGVPHILEHSVLCGSEKYPVKEPFVELAKGSLNTFLNAMTFDDKTMYPIASKNDKDFLNLMDVYLDAVFNPNIYKYPEILMQEGWHYELEAEDAEITYKGVVYNEMQGAFSSPEGVLMRKISLSLLPETIYGVESGGDPEFIPDLTQENFEKFHSTYYHPANSYIYLYGDLDIEEKLRYLSDEYLNKYEKIEVNSEIVMQEPFKEPRTVVETYPISENEKEDDKTYLSLNFAIGTAYEIEHLLAFEVLENLLLETSASPLKRALINANLGKDVFGSFDSGIMQPIFSIIIKNSNSGQKEQFEQVVFDTLRDLVKNGIDKSLIEATINILEFNLRESDFQGYPAGLIYNIKLMESWLYDSSPVLHLEYEKALTRVKKALTENYLEELIEKYLLNNNHRSMLIVKPEKGLAEKKAKKIQEKLKAYKKSLSKDEIQKLIAETQKLKERQSTPDSQEDIEKLPLLSLTDIEPSPEILPLEEVEINGVKVLKHSMFTNKISYINLYFDTMSIKQELLPYVSLLTSLLGKIDTKNYKYEDLSKEVNIHTGGIGYSSRAFTQMGRDSEFEAKFIVKAKALTVKLPKLGEIIAETIINTKFDDKRRIKEIVQELRSRFEMKINQEGHNIAAGRLISYFSEFGKYTEITSGFEYYNFIVELDKNFDVEFEAIKDKLQQVYDMIFRKPALIASITSSDEDYNIFETMLKALTDKLKIEQRENIKYNLELKKGNEGLMTSSNVQFVAKGYNYKKLGFDYTGSLLVLKTIARYDYLWNRIRVMGGAYGCSVTFSRIGNIYFSSYRDPNLKESLTVYDEMEQYLKEFDADEREMTKYIIGTISDLDFPMTPSTKGNVSDADYFNKITFEDNLRERQEVLSTNVETIKGFAALVRDSMRQDYICTLGNGEKLKSEANIFSKLIDVFE